MYVFIYEAFSRYCLIAPEFKCARLGEVNCRNFREEENGKSEREIISLRIIEETRYREISSLNNFLST